MEIPVYLFTGFLESGKTKFIQETLEDKRFNSGERTLVLLCEEGEEELDPASYPGKNVFVRVIEEPGQLNPDDLSKMVKSTRSERVIVEYNGMWMMNELLSGMPEDWVMAQVFAFVDASTFEAYNANMRQLMFDKLSNADMVVFNRMKDSYSKEELHKAVRTCSRSVDIIYEDLDGNVTPDDIEDPLPFDLDAPVVEIDDNSYAIWYRDMVEDMLKYNGKVIKVKVMAQPKGKYPTGFFIFGREIMTCCVEDIRFAGLAGKYSDIASLEENGWYIMTGRIELRFTKLYNRKGPVFYIDSMEPADAPEQPVATFY